MLFFVQFVHFLVIRNQHILNLSHSKPNFSSCVPSFSFHQINTWKTTRASHLRLYSENPVNCYFPEIGTKTGFYLCNLPVPDWEDAV